MTSIGKRIVGAITVAAVLVLIVVVWHISHRPQDPLEQKATQTVGDFDQFQQDLATRVLKQYGAGSDFSVIVATTAYPLGTLLRATGSIPADSDDCLPATLPKPLSSPHLFPSYSMSTDTALAANLGSRAIQALDSAGVSLRQSQNVQYAIADTQLQIMDDKSVEKVAGQGNCGHYISAHPGVRLVRGAVIGKLTFTVKVDNPASVKAQFAKIGGFSVSDNPQSSTLNVADQQDQAVVELLSEFGVTANAPTSPPTPRPVEAVSPSAQAPAPVGSGPHMFVQMDAQDDASSGAKIVQLLRTNWPSANVESKVERIPSRSVPNTAQVRYFNGSDADVANRCVSILRRVYPNARVVRIGLAAPGGQIEIWLPKTNIAGAK